MDFLLHIGFAKTGTTTIQQMLANNESILAAAGVRYLASGRNGLNHDELARSALPKRRRGALPANYQPLQRQIADELASTRPDLSIVSCEGLSARRLRNHDLTPLRRLLGPGNITVVGVLRDHVSWLESLYAQMLKTGRTHQAPHEFLEQYLGQQAVPFSQILRNWSGFAAPMGLVLADYESVRGRLVEWFLTVAGVNRAVTERLLADGPADANLRIGARATAIMNHLSRHRGEMLVARRYLRLLWFLDRQLTGDEPGTYFDDSDRSRILETYAADTIEIRARYCTDFATMAPRHATNRASLELPVSDLRHVVSVIEARLAEASMPVPARGQLSLLAHFDQLWTAWDGRLAGERPPRR